MANSIDKITKYIAELDKMYKYMSKTAVLDAAPAQVRQADAANQIKIAKMTLQGLGDYDRNTGYVSGDVTLDWETHTFTQDRGRKFSVDAMDNEETANLSFGMLAGEFVRTKTIPEFDAYRMAVYATAAIANGSYVKADITTGANALAAIDVAQVAMNDAEVPEEGRLLYVSNSFLSLLKSAPTIYRHIGSGNDGTFNRKFETLDDMRIIPMPKTRFYTAITQYDGSTSGQEAGGYIKNASTGKDINFLIIHPSAVLQVMKHAVTKIISPAENQTSDGWLYFFRAYHDAFVYENKKSGIYVHHRTT